MNFSKWEKQEWFIQLKKNVSEFHNKENAVESAKFGFDRDIKIPEWILGIGISLLIFSKIIIDNLEPLWKNIAYLLYLTTAIVLLVGIWKIIILAQRHRVGMMYVYRKKDKQDKEMVQDQIDKRKK